MSEPHLDSPLLQQQNPEESQFSKPFPDPQKYKLSQSYFTTDELLSQPGYQVFERDEFLYFGGTYNAMRHGWGVLITKHTVFEGKFSLNHKLGKGYLKFANGSVYVGDFTNDKPHGQGLLQYEEEYFIGDFENGMMQGDGLWRNKHGDKYVGQWRSNKAHGHGIYVTQQSHYQGEFNQFVKHGYGVETFKNGDVYRGNYTHGKPHGYGEYIWISGANYKGQFLDGFRQGQGVWVSETGDKYSGHFSADRKNGFGQYNWANGNQYKGEFCEDMREGQGEMLWNDGSVYQGQWQRGLPHGKGNFGIIQLGIFKVKGEKPHVGIFEDNVLVSQYKNAKIGNELSGHGSSRKHDNSLILAMIPELSKRRGRFAAGGMSETKKKFRKRFSPASTSASFMTPANTRTWRSRMK